MADILNHMKIMNNALAQIGAGAIMAEDEDTDLARQVVAIYYSRLEAVFAMHDWSFAGKTYKLDRIPEDADHDYILADNKFMTGWRHAFAMPGTRMSLPRVLQTDPRRPENPLRDFSIEQDVIYTDAEVLYGTFTVLAAPTAWKKDFKLGVEAIVAAALCIPVCDAANLASQLRIDAEGSPGEQGRGGLIGRALAADAAASRRVAPMWNDPLSAARFG